MIVLDTNVISEIMKKEVNPFVRGWFNRQVQETVFITAITEAELLFGIRILPESKKRRELSSILEEILTLFQGKILPFDRKAAEHYAELARIARKNGKGFPVPDGYIAAIATSKKFLIASRDAAPFEAANIKILNPWKKENQQ